MRKHTKPPERASHNHEDDALVAGELCIRFMERVMEGVMADPELSPHYDSIRALVGNVVQDELKQFAFDFAYELFSDEHVIRQRRFFFEQSATKETENN